MTALCQQQKKEKPLQLSGLSIDGYYVITPLCFLCTA